MQIRVNNEPRPWPPHYSPPWNPQKSDIVSLRFHSQSSGTLFIVGWTESELRIDIRGPQTSCAYDHRTSCGAGSQRALKASFQIWVRSHKPEPFIYFFIVYNLKCMPVLLLLFLPGIYICSFCHSLEVGNSPAAAQILWLLFHAWDGRAAFRGALSRLLPSAIFLNLRRAELGCFGTVFTRSCRDCAASALCLGRWCHWLVN